MNYGHILGQLQHVMARKGKPVKQHYLNISRIQVCQ